VELIYCDVPGVYQRGYGVEVDATLGTVAG
jgi:hypothetical protein